MSLTGGVCARTVRGLDGDLSSHVHALPRVGVRWRSVSAVVVAIRHRPRRLLIALTTWESSREQADVSAEQPAPFQDARFPPAHEHPGRPRHPGRASPEGSRGTLRLIRPPGSRGASQRSPDASRQRILRCGAQRPSRRAADSGHPSEPHRFGSGLAGTSGFCRVQGGRPGGGEESREAATASHHERSPGGTAVGRSRRGAGQPRGRRFQHPRRRLRQRSGGCPP